MATKKSIVDSYSDKQIPKNLITEISEAAQDITTSEQHPQDKFEDIIKALEEILSEKNISQKSRLSGDNITGMLQATNLNTYLDNYYHFKILGIEELMNDKLVKTISFEGLGREELIRIVEALKATIETNMMKPTTTDKMVGK